ncbi:tRNA pseudouridine synthase A [Secundilactobacillus oryzae JCM 18671]|uniref:tRNA pseudouridine synthase A n=1 Tax=Secundilactobacillus oryzae JCM 18671 TaxID=1291743 RepID=A0A081BK59_9LACO|nr:tRNA pseudouridine(38-40) synthase TruA [Secundilactobacillus oryzae]GAK48427.1 tRNA pseudouridine synthase A [Secundilactobacillus oryzae JCM 18671]
MSARYKLILTYDGTNFAGFQRQPDTRTVEGELTKAVNLMAKKPTPAIIVYGSGRTDAGVHALGQVVHFDFPFDIPADSMRKGLNSILPVDMEVLVAEIAKPEFHARYDVSGKRYVYRIDLGEFRNPFKRNYAGHWKFPVDEAKIRLAMKDLIGEHDFSSFVASGSSVRSNVRTIYEAKVERHEADNELVFEFYGNGFLYNQVRIMVGVLIEIGSGTRPVDDIQRLYKLGDRRYARRTVSASGLYLKHVYYEGDDPEHPTKLPKHQR